MDLTTESCPDLTVAGPHFPVTVSSDDPALYTCTTKIFQLYSGAQSINIRALRIFFVSQVPTLPSPPWDTSNKPLSALVWLDLNTLKIFHIIGDVPQYPVKRSLNKISRFGVSTLFCSRGGSIMFFIFIFRNNWQTLQDLNYQSLNIFHLQTQI